MNRFIRFGVEKERVLRLEVESEIVEDLVLFVPIFVGDSAPCRITATGSLMRIGCVIACAALPSQVAYRRCALCILDSVVLLLRKRFIKRFSDQARQAKTART